jgi:hypothetical protein
VSVEPERIKGVVSESMLFDIGYADSITPAPGGPSEAGPQRHKNRLITATQHQIARTTTHGRVTRQEKVTRDLDQRLSVRKPLVLPDSLDTVKLVEDSVGGYHEPV